MSMPPSPPAQDSLQGFAHFMQKEIHEQTDRVRSCLANYLPSDPVSCLPDLPTDWLTALDQIHILASGTSRHAGLVAQHWLEQWANVPVRVRSSSEFLLAPLPLTRETLTIAITQSGETADTLAAVDAQAERYRSLGEPRIVGITNQPASSLAKRVMRVLPTYAGKEVSVAATKTFTTQLAVLACLTLAIARHRGTVEAAKLALLSEQLRSLPDQIEQVLRQEREVAAIAQALQNATSCILLGQGEQQAVALEGALKLKETAYLHAEGYAAGEFLHGPIALLDERIPVIAVYSSNSSHSRTSAAVERIRAVQARTIGILTAVTASEAARFDYAIPLPDGGIWSPFLTVIPLQLLAYHTALQRGLDVDRPRNLTKTLST